MSEQVLTRLHGGLTQRRTPQAVARDLVELGALSWLAPAPAAELSALARMGMRSSMPERYARHPGLHAPYHSAVRAMDAVAGAAGAEALAGADPTDADQLAAWLSKATALLGLGGQVQPAQPSKGSRLREVTYEAYDGTKQSYTYPRRPRGARGEGRGHLDARTRLDAASRRDALPGVSVRTYRHAVRAVLHLQQRAGVLARVRELEAAVEFGKSRLASELSFAQFAHCERAAAFVAYYTARLGLRTLFTNGEQARPMDSVAEALLESALAAPSPGVLAISRVLTRRSVLTGLTGDEQGALLGLYFERLRRTASVLEASFDPARDRTAMTVRRGDDSSTWNAATRAFNQARTGWLNLLGALELSESVTEAFLFGKVPALIASDVAAWHALSGSEAHADLAIWAQLPLPWEVLSGRATCTRAMVEAACESVGLDAAVTGWTQGYRQDGLAEPAPAPELVHGVTVASPWLAELLRSQGVFSGQA